MAILGGNTQVTKTGGLSASSTLLSSSTTSGYPGDAITDHVVPQPKKCPPGYVCAGGIGIPKSATGTATELIRP